MEISLFAKANISLQNSLISSRKVVIVLQFRLWKQQLVLNKKKALPEQAFESDQQRKKSSVEFTVFLWHMQ